MQSELGAQRDGRVCVAIFDPPGATERLREWEQANRGRYGPSAEWVIDIGRAADGGFTRVWVPGEHVSPA